MDRSRGGGLVEALPSEPLTLQFPDWQRAFEAAMRETDPATLAARLRAAKLAIFSRLKTKAECPPGFLERIALNDAIHLLRVLRSEGEPDTY
jgi:hypothetical protein